MIVQLACACLALVAAIVSVVAFVVAWFPVPLGMIVVGVEVFVVLATRSCLVAAPMLNH